MALEQHLETLRRRHMEIDLKILAEHSRPSPDDKILGRLKKEKLHLKDEINGLAYQQQAA